MTPDPKTHVGVKGGAFFNEGDLLFLPAYLNHAGTFMGYDDDTRGFRTSLNPRRKKVDSGQ